MRLRMRRAMKAIAPPVTIPSMGTSTRDCRNSGESWRERWRKDYCHRHVCVENIGEGELSIKKSSSLTCQREVALHRSHAVADIQRGIP